MLGGAIAIGVGFGAQNIINNFISSWILLAGQSVRVDDLIEVDHHHGHVVSIGPRSTQIRRHDGIDMLVPNSHLIEHTVVNWTLTDEVIRAEIQVGVAYHSDPDRVAGLMQQAAELTPPVLADPAPTVVFENFGDNALEFTLFAWIRTDSDMGLRRAASEVRFRISRLLRESGVTIAYPQRDIHLDSAGPLEVRVVPERGRVKDAPGPTPEPRQPAGAPASGASRWEKK